MQVTNEQLNKAAQALRRQRNPGGRPWELTTEALKDVYRSEVRAVLELVPDEAAKERKRWRVEDGVRHLTDRLHLVIDVETADPYVPPFRGYWFLKSDGFTLEIVERLRDELNARLDAEEAKCK